MAQRRMFSLKITDTDAFCEMPLSAQALYFHIGQRADDDGLYSGVKGLMAKVHASADDLNILIAKGFVIDRGDSIYLVKHWRINNYLRNDRYVPSEYQDKLKGVYLKTNGSYTLDENQGKPLLQSNNVGIPMVSLDKDSIGKDR